MQKTHLTAFLALMCSLLCVACAPEPVVHEMSGEAWGTTYRIKIVAADRDFDAREVSDALQDTLREVDDHLSNWNPNSEVSRFNRLATTEPFAISATMTSVLAASNEVHDKSDGHLDLTLAPIIELWGFGAKSVQNADQIDPPRDAEIAEAMAKVGQRSVLAHRAGTSELRKLKPEATVFLSALAKGAGIDAIAQSLNEVGYENYLVEVGGDLIAAGSGATGRGWRIAIERPTPGARMAGDVVALQGQAMATSGDYRNYFEKDGMRYSHIIDPSTGRPISHRTASVTVLSDKAVFADAWATALLAAGVERGLVIAEREGIAALFISRSGNTSQDEFERVRSSQFERLTAKP